MRGGGGLRGLSQWVQAVYRNPNKLWRSSSIFNLCVQHMRRLIFSSYFPLRSPYFPFRLHSLLRFWFRLTYLWESPWSMAARMRCSTTWMWSLFTTRSLQHGHVGFHHETVNFLTVLQIHDILVWIRIRIRIQGFMPLTNGSGSFYLHHWPSRWQQKN